MKRFEISYNPYSNRIHFRVAVPIDEESVSDWRGLQAESNFMEYQNSEIVFENNVGRILSLINNYINTTESLEIVFNGTTEDFETLQNAVYACSDPRARKITCTHKDVYLSSKTALERIKLAFSKIEKDFDYYFTSYQVDAGISEDYIRYKDVVKPEIPVCLIGLGGVGKTNLINAFIGMKILPSQSNRTNMIIRNDSKYRIEFNYHNEFYVITIEGNNYSVKTPSKPDNEMISSVFGGYDSCTNEKDIMHLALERIISKDAEEGFLGEFGGCVSVYVPFRESLLDLKNYSYAFIDTSVFFTDEEDDYSIVYGDIVLSQTNALPIVIATRDTLISNDIFDLKRVIKELGTGFARPNSIIAISKSDELIPSQIKNDIPDDIRESIANPTICYVSPDIALGTMSDGYKEKNKTIKAILKNNPSKHNIIPRNQGIFRSDKDGIDKLLCASGIPSLEFELSYYTAHFADYKKCANGQQYLLDAISKLIIELKKSKMQLEDELQLDKEKRKKDKSAIRSEMIGSIDQKQKPDLNSAFNIISKQFEFALNEYCSGIPDAVRECWGKVGHRANDIDNLVEGMRQHCQENLYDRYSDEIKLALQVELLGMTAKYIDSLDSCIEGKYDHLSNDAKAALRMVLDEKPNLIDVNVESFVAVSLKNPIQFVSSDESKITYYSKGFEGQLRPNENRCGHFYNQCILEPTIAYSNQLNQWIEQQLSEIRKIIDSDQAILSKYDARIEELEKIISDLTERLDNLNNVRDSLIDLLPENEHDIMMEE